MSPKKQSARSNIKKRSGRAPHGYGGIRPSKGLGQNFLIDEEAIEAIVEGSGAAKDALVIEIGPGAGALTLPLAEKAGRLVAVELDKEMIEPLRVKTFGMENVEIIHSDILKTDISAIIEERKAEYGLDSVCVVGNLPYYITTPIIMKLLETASGIDSITVMMQKEVADRVAAKPGSRLAGAITYPVHYFAEVSKIIDVSRDSFYPVPAVDSAVLRLDLRDYPAVEVRDPRFMFRLVRAGFSQRRKTILNSLSAIEGIDKDILAASLDAAHIERSRRAETLLLSEFARLSDELQEA